MPIHMIDRKAGSPPGHQQSGHCRQRCKI